MSPCPKTSLRANSYCSLPQLGVRGEERSPAEAALLSRGLLSLAPLYSHPHTTTLKMTKLPPGYPHAGGYSFPLGVTPNTAAYDERGWVSGARLL